MKKSKLGRQKVQFRENTLHNRHLLLRVPFCAVLQISRMNILMLSAFAKHADTHLIADVQRDYTFFHKNTKSESAAVDRQTPTKAKQLVTTLEWKSYQHCNFGNQGRRSGSIKELQSLRMTLEKVSLGISHVVALEQIHWVWFLKGQNSPNVAILWGEWT